MDNVNTRCALLIAYHYPPVKVSSGIQRTLSNSRFLRDNNWQPIVLSAHPRAYAKTSEDQLADIPQDVLVERAFALDTGRHLAVGGRYMDFMALPDRWVSWWLGGVISGLHLIRKHKPAVLWSTYPIATAHLIGLTLHRLTGVPWVADFRDSMTEEGYPRERRQRRVFQWIERRTVENCSRAVFTTPGAVRMYRERYPEIPEERWALIPNGYDEDIFAQAEAQAKPALQVRPTGPRVLVHAGAIYPQERDPQPFFQAIASLKRDGLINTSRLKVVLRATGHDHLYQPLLEELDIADIVELAPGVSYREALGEILGADGLLLFQAANCNHQIPAKLYEYFRAQRPVLALTDAGGDTAATMRKAGLHSCAPLDDVGAIRQALIDFLQDMEDGRTVVASAEAVATSSRSFGVRELAAMFDSLSVSP